MIKIITAIFLLSIYTHASTQLGNGGDAVLQSFNLRGRQVGYYLQERPELAQKFGVNVSHFLETVKNTKLESKDRLYLNGIEVDAINYPKEGRIEVSRQRWLLRGSSERAFLEERRLSLHEFLWMSGVDDTDYKISNAVIAEFDRDTGPLQDPDVKQLLLNKFCYTIAKLDFASAMKYLAWGVDLNGDCLNEVYYHIRHNPPMSYLLLTGTAKLSEKQTSDRRELFRKLIIYGTNPNGETKNWYCVSKDCYANDFTYFLIGSLGNIEDAKTLIEFGADPNLRVPFRNTSLFGEAMLSRNSVEAFLLLLNSGGDVNLNYKARFGVSAGKSPARAIVTLPGQSDVFEALITHAEVDWCRVDLDGGWEPNTLKVIDHVLPEYKYLLKKYGVVCSSLAPQAHF
jgi:hypothetical protein